MGRIKDLKDKVAKGEATPEEIAELEEAETEANEPTPTPSESEDEAVERLADALVTKITSKIDKATQKVTTSTATVPVSPEAGKLNMEDLSMKVMLPGRKEAGKAVTEVTAKTGVFLNALLTGDKEKLQLLTEGTAANGGYLVPEEFANMIVEDKRDVTIMRQLADHMTITTDTLHLPTLNSRPVANWRSEAAVKATSTATFSELVFTPYSLAVIVGLSQELASDAQLGVGGSIINYIARLMTRALAEKEEAAFWTGNGSGKPTGVNNYSLGSIDAGGTDSSLADAIKVIEFQLSQGYRSGAAYVAHKQAWARVAKLKDTQGNYLLTRLGDANTARLAGYPIYEQNDLPTDIILFGDFSYYMIVDRQGVTVDFSTEATVAGSSAFEKNLVFIRVEERTDGELTLTDAVKKITGLN